MITDGNDASAMRALRVLLIAALLLLFVVGLLDMARAADHSVSIQFFAYSPQTANVSVGDKVIWTNLDGTVHDVVAFDSSFSSPALQQNQQFEHTFTEPGAFQYFCSFHGGMQGSVVVNGSATPTPTATSTPSVTPTPTPEPTAAPTATPTPITTPPPNPTPCEADGPVTELLAGLADSLGPLRDTVRSVACALHGLTTL